MGYFRNLANAYRLAKLGLSIDSIEKSDSISWADQLRFFRQSGKTDADGFDVWSKSAMEKISARNALVYACVRTKSMAFQQPPFCAFKKTAEGTWEKDDSSKILDPLTKNPELSESEIKQYISMHLNLTGQAFLWGWTDLLGNKRELWPVLPSWVTINLAESIDSDVDENGKKRRRIIESFTIKPPNSDKEWVVPPESVIYYRFPDPSNLWGGLGPIQAACKNIQLDMKGDAYKAEAMDALRLPGVVVKTRKPLNQKQKDDLRAVLRQKTGGDARMNAVLISGDDAALEMLNPMKEFDWKSYTELNETRICMAFGVPPIVVGSLVGLENSPWSNTGDAKRWMYQNTMMSEWEMTAYITTAGLVKMENRDTLHIGYDLDDIKELRDDLDQLWERARFGYNDGLITRNEARELIGQSTTDDGNVYKYSAATILVPAGTGIPAPPPLTQEEQEEGIRAMEDDEL